VKEMMKTKLRATMVQAQGLLPVRDLGQGLALDHVPDLDQDPDHNPDQSLAHDQVQDIDQAQEVEAVHVDAVPHLAVGHVPIHVQKRGEDPGLVFGVAVHITTDRKDLDPEVCRLFLPGNVMLEAGITPKRAIAWEFLD